MSDTCNRKIFVRTSTVKVMGHFSTFREIQEWFSVFYGKYKTSYRATGMGMLWNFPEVLTPKLVLSVNKHYKMSPLFVKISDKAKNDKKSQKWHKRCIAHQKHELCLTYIARKELTKIDRIFWFFSCFLKFNWRLWSYALMLSITWKIYRNIDRNQKDWHWIVGVAIACTCPSYSSYFAHSTPTLYINLQHRIINVQTHSSGHAKMWEHH